MWRFWGKLGVWSAELGLQLKPLIPRIPKSMRRAGGCCRIPLSPRAGYFFWDAGSPCGVALSSRGVLVEQPELAKGGVKRDDPQNPFQQKSLRGHPHLRGLKNPRPIHEPLRSKPPLLEHNNNNKPRETTKPHGRVPRGRGGDFYRRHGRTGRQKTFKGRGSGARGRHSHASLGAAMHLY